MTTKFRLLIDTNVFFAVEDSHKVSEEHAEFYRLASKYATLFIHELTTEDINRDTQVQRKAQSLSKVRKYQLLKVAAADPHSPLAPMLNKQVKPNDFVDISLLEALRLGLVEFLITEDLGIHAKAKNISLANNVMTIRECLAWLRQVFEPQSPKQIFVDDVLAHEIPLNDEIFISLREGYPNFEGWWKTKCVALHRRCWTVKSVNEIAALVVYKPESSNEALCMASASKILKLCTFKVKPKFRGEKLGELLLRHSLFYAVINSYDTIYLTAFADQPQLINLFEQFGFRRSRELPNGEGVYERSVLPVQAAEPLHPLQFARRFYPSFIWNNSVRSFVVPIRPNYHLKLFPEIAELTPLPLFPDEGRSQLGWLNRKPANTIDKVYLCRASTTAIQQGDVLLFYKSKDNSTGSSQSITTIAVVKDVQEFSTAKNIIVHTAKRSVFSELEITAMTDVGGKPIKVLDFMLVKHLDQPVGLIELMDRGVLRAAPQAVTCLSDEQVQNLKEAIGK